MQFTSLRVHAGNPRAPSLCALRAAPRALPCRQPVAVRAVAENAEVRECMLWVLFMYIRSSALKELCGRRARGKRCGRTSARHAAQPRIKHRAGMMHIPASTAQLLGSQLLSEAVRSCDRQGRIVGGIGGLPGFAWWPIKAYRPCPALAQAGLTYTRRVPSWLPLRRPIGGEAPPDRARVLQEGADCGRDAVWQAEGAEAVTCAASWSVGSSFV